MKQIRIAVGTKNPCKISAVRACFSEYFPPSTHEIIIVPKDVPSGVRDQPFGDEETKLGAMNRARAAYESGDFEFGVGLEGGIEIIQRSGVGSSPTSTSSDQEDLWCMAFMCVIGSTSEPCTSGRHPESTFQPSLLEEQEKELRGIAKTAAFPLPRKISHLVIHEKMELGHADDQVFGRVNSKEGDGTVGMLTNGFISRTEYYDHTLKLALIPFVWPELYVE